MQNLTLSHTDYWGKGNMGYKERIYVALYPSKEEKKWGN